MIAAVLIFKYWEPIKAFFEGLWDGFTENLDPVRKAMEPLAPIGEAIGAAFKTIGEKIEPLIQWFKDLLTPIKDTDKETEAARKTGVILR